MTVRERKKLINKIIKEEVSYVGLINFASRGCGYDTAGLIKAFNYGVEVGVECMKTDAVRIVNEA